VIVLLAAPDREENIVEKGSSVREIDGFAESVFKLHVVKEDLFSSHIAKLEGTFAYDAEPHMLQQRHALAERHRRTPMIDFQRRLFFILLRMPVEIDRDPVFIR